MRSVFVKILILVVLIIALNRDNISFANNRLSGLPKVMLWAWECPEKLKFINPGKFGVAFLAKTIYLRGDKVIVRPRLQPLELPEGTALMAVVRIEIDRFHKPKFSFEQRKKAVCAITKLCHIPKIVGIQIDFDTTVSERGFYKDIILELRQQLPDSIGLSMTALASWCIYDNWLSGLPVDEIVPMLFRMGPDHHQIVRYLQSGRDFQPAVAQNSLGIATDEKALKLPPGRRIYIFHPKPWTREAVEKSLKELKQ